MVTAASAAPVSLLNRDRTRVRSSRARAIASTDLDTWNDMQLRTARLCLDCEEIHEGQQCPVCASETFAYITRWVPIPRRPEPHPARRTEAPEQVRDYQRLLVAETAAPKRARLLKRGAIGLALVSVARWAWVRHRRGQSHPRTEDRQPSHGTAAGLES